MDNSEGYMGLFGDMKEKEELLYLYHNIKNKIHRIKFSTD